jgi:hypothetical protein
LRSSGATASAATFGGSHPNGRPKFEGTPGLTDMVMSYMREKRAEANEKLGIIALTENWAFQRTLTPLDSL